MYNCKETAAQIVPNIKNWLLFKRSLSCLIHKLENTFSVENGKNGISQASPTSPFKPYSS